EVDTTFGTSGTVAAVLGGAIFVVRPLSSGKIMLGGYTGANPNLRFALARLNSDGSLDSAFGTNGKVTGDSADFNFIADIAELPDGKIVATGNSGYNLAARRYDQNGNLDTTFGNAGEALVD